MNWKMYRNSRKNIIRHQDPLYPNKAIFSYLLHIDRFLLLFTFILITFFSNKISVLMPIVSFENN